MRCVLSTEISFQSTCIFLRIYIYIHVHSNDSKHKISSPPVVVSFAIAPALGPPTPRPRPAGVAAGGTPPGSPRRSRKPSPRAGGQTDRQTRPSGTPLPVGSSLNSSAPAGGGYVFPQLRAGCLQSRRTGKRQTPPSRTVPPPAEMQSEEG